MDTKRIQLATSARWFVGLVTAGAVMMTLMSGGFAIAAIVAAAGEHGPDTVAAVFGLGGFSLLYGALAAWGFWTVRVTRQGRPLAIQIYLVLDALSAAFGIINLFTVPTPDQIAARIFGLIITAAIIWWHYCVLQSLQSPPKSYPDLPAAARVSLY